MLLLIKPSTVYLTEAEAVVAETSLKGEKLSSNHVGLRAAAGQKSNNIKYPPGWKWAAQKWLTRLVHRNNKENIFCLFNCLFAGRNNPADGLDWWLEKLAVKSQQFSTIQFSYDPPHWPAFRRLLSATVQLWLPVTVFGPHSKPRKLSLEATVEWNGNSLLWKFLYCVWILELFFFFISIF